MAKNIKQMAEEYALSQVLSCTDTEMTQQAYLSIRMFNGYDVACGYKDGANYVLEEIEKCLDNPSMIQGYSDILAKVQELKGE